jgi:hypothetical protein
VTLEGGEPSPASEEPKVEPAPDGRPPFARKYPRTEDLDALLAAFEAGNYAKVRADAPKLAERASDPEVARALRDLRRRIEPDPLQIYLLAITAALLVFLTVWFFLHRH